MAGLVATSTNDQARLVRALMSPALYGDWCASVRVLETHISYVLLTGRYAFKIKKAVNLGFLDFTTLAARRFYCERELHLNRRLAPALYVDVVAITGTAESPEIGGNGPALEYAVQMLEFPQDALLTCVLKRGELTVDHVDALAATVAMFHQSHTGAASDSRIGSADQILELAEENFTEIARQLEAEADHREIGDVRRWTRCEFAARAPVFAARHRGGFVRECHGDLHLGNIALVEGAATVFDCIEFNDAMRWSDVMADVAFLVMDLQDRGRPDYAARFLNRYLELTGDYDGLQVLRFYVVYRAVVRAKIACMRASQTDASDAREAHMAEYRDYLNLAKRYSESTTRGIVITRGPTGSGKTTLTQGLVDLLGAVRIRTDVERKRLHGLTPLARSGSALNAGLYATKETARTYSTIARLTRTVASAGYPVVVDGTFLQRRQREQFRAVAADATVPFVIVEFVAPQEMLRRRVCERHEGGLDASEADVRVLKHQLEHAEALSSDERFLTVTYDASAPLERSRRPESWQMVVDTLRQAYAGGR